VVNAARVISEWGFVITPDILAQTAKDVGEASILSRTGGAPTLAVGMAQILHSVISGDGMMAFWYHYAILFEALFILTAVDAGTRVARFMIQEIGGMVYAPLKQTESWGANIIATALAVALWGYFLYQGVVDPLGGINTLWPLFGIANQMLAGIALTYCTVVLFKMKRGHYAWVTILPTAWLLICTLSAGWLKLFDANPKVGFLANARRFADAATSGQVLAPAKTIEEMGRVAFNNYLNAGLCVLFMVVLLSTVGFGIREILRARRSSVPISQETPYVAFPA
jgi:carbon starvation protein